MAARKAKKNDVITIEEIYVLHNIGTPCGGKTQTAICAFCGNEESIPMLRAECVKNAKNRLKDITKNIIESGELPPYARKWFTTNYMLTREELYQYDCVEFGTDLLMYECDTTDRNADENSPMYEDLMKAAYADVRKELDILQAEVKKRQAKKEKMEGKATKKTTKTKQPEQPETKVEGEENDK